MGQSEIINFLHKQKQPVSLIDLSRYLNTNKTNIARACRKLRKANEIKVIRKREKSFTRFLVSIH